MTNDTQCEETAIAVDSPVSLKDIFAETLANANLYSISSVDLPAIKRTPGVDTKKKDEEGKPILSNGKWNYEDADGVWRDDAAVLSVVILALRNSRTLWYPEEIFNTATGKPVAACTSSDGSVGFLRDNTNVTFSMSPPDTWVEEGICVDEQGKPLCPHAKYMANWRCNTRVDLFCLLWNEEEMRPMGLLPYVIPLPMTSRTQYNAYVKSLTKGATVETFKALKKMNFSAPLAQTGQVAGDVFSTVTRLRVTTHLNEKKQIYSKAAFESGIALPPSVADQIKEYAAFFDSILTVPKPRAIAQKTEEKQEEIATDVGQPKDMM